MIKRLPKDVCSHLRTGVALTSVAQCVEELVLNSVDAGATCVAVRLDLQSLTIQVVDNGKGISREELPLVGQRYSTSKCHTVEDLDNLKYFGYRGEALASICSASSFVEIITWPAGSSSTCTKCFHKGRPLAVTEPAVGRPGVGTTVTAHNLFYNLPVRKKSLNEGLELERTRYRVAGLALMWPAISFSLRDDSSGNVILQTHKCGTILGTFSSLFGAARVKQMRQVEGKGDVVGVSGYVSRENHSRNDLQFVFVNRRLVLKSKVHKMLNSILGKSVLVRRRGGNLDKPEGQERSPGERRSPTKLFERYAVYVINIECPLSAYDITFDPAKTFVEFHDWPGLTTLVESMLMTFLREEHLLLPSERQEAEEIDAQISSSGDGDVTPNSGLSMTDDPFAGADEGIDEGFHDSVQRKRYAQGISTHSTLNSLFSRTVRRPGMPVEEEGFEDLLPSSPKKGKMEGSTDHSDRSLSQKPGPSKIALPDKSSHVKKSGEKKCSKSGLSHETSNTKKSGEKECGTDNHNMESEGEEQLEREERTAVAKTRCQGYNSNTSQEMSDTTHADANEDWTETIITATSAITLPPAKRSSRKGTAQTSRKPVFTRVCKHQDVPMMRRSAQTSSLDRLRARLSGALQSSSPASASSVVPAVTQSISLDTATSHSIHRERALEQGDKSTTESQSKVDKNPAENSLSSASRPQLCRSKSLDAKDSCHQNETRSSAANHSHSERAQASDDDCINYTTLELVPSLSQGNNRPKHSGLRQSCPQISLPPKRKAAASNGDPTNSGRRGTLNTNQAQARQEDPTQSVCMVSNTEQSVSETGKSESVPQLGQAEPVLNPSAVTRSSKPCHREIAARRGVRSQASKLALLMRKAKTCSEDECEKRESTEEDAPSLASLRSYSHRRQSNHKTCNQERLHEQEASQTDIPTSLHPGDRRFSNLGPSQNVKISQPSTSSHEFNLFRTRWAADHPSISEHASDGDLEDTLSKKCRVRRDFSLNLFQTRQNLSSDKNNPPTSVIDTNEHLPAVPPAATCWKGMHSIESTQRQPSSSENSLTMQCSSSDSIHDNPSRAPVQDDQRFSGNAPQMQSEECEDELSSQRSDQEFSGNARQRQNELCEGEMSSQGFDIGSVGETSYSHALTDSCCVGRLARQDTQGFLACSSQGFLPHSSEEVTAETMDTASHTAVGESESPLSTCSTGFIPGDCDPSLVDFVTNITSGTDRDKLPTSSSVVERVTGAKTLTAVERKSVDTFHSDSPENSELQREMPSSIITEQSSLLATSNEKQRVNDTEDSTHQSDSLEKLSGPVQSRSSLTLPVLSEAHLPVTACEQGSQVGICEQSMPASAESVSDAQAQLSNSHSLSSTCVKTNQEETLVQTLSSSSELPCGQRPGKTTMASPSAGSSSEVGLSVTSSHGVSSCSPESQHSLSSASVTTAKTSGKLYAGSVTNTSVVSFSSPISQHSFSSVSVPTAETSGKLSARSVASQHGKCYGQREHNQQQSDTMRVCPPSEDKDSNILPQDSTNTFSESLSSAESTDSYKSRCSTLIKGRPVVDRTYNLSFLHEKQPKLHVSSCISAESDMSSMDNTGGKDVCEAEAQHLQMSTLSPHGESKAGLSTCSSQQTADFSDSVTDSALAEVAMPDNGILDTFDVNQDSSTPNSVPDSVLCNIELSEKEPAGLTGNDQNTTSSQLAASSAEKQISTSCSSDKYVSAVTNSVSATPEMDIDCITQNAFKLGAALSPSESTITATAAEACNLSGCVPQSVSMCTASDNDGTVSKPLAAKSASVSSSASVLGSTSGRLEGIPHNNQDGSKSTTKKTKWIPVADPVRGSTVYMNSSSGHTMTLAQWNQLEMDGQHDLDSSHCDAGDCRQTQQTPDVTPSACEQLSPASHRTMTALVAAHWEEEEEESLSKWKDRDRDEQEEEEGSTVMDMLSAWQNPVFTNPERIVGMVSRTQAGRMARPLFCPTTFTKSMLATGKVIGQLDNKFVACLIPEEPQPHSTSCSQGGSGEGLVVLFDQHAAHERVRLEQLCAELYETSDTDRRIKRSDVKPPRTVHLSEEDVRVMQSFKDEYERTGVVFDVDPHQRDVVHVHTIPACMAQREANDRKRGKDPLSYRYLELMIEEHNQLLLSTAGAGKQLPRQVHRLLATHACRGAIKFGEKLSLSTCKELLSTLSTCDLPFQCAHGRPSITPLISLTQLIHSSSEDVQPPKLWKLRQGAAATAAAETSNQK